MFSLHLFRGASTSLTTLPVSFCVVEYSVSILVIPRVHLYTVCVLSKVTPSTGPLVQLYMFLSRILISAFCWPFPLQFLEWSLKIWPAESNCVNGQTTASFHRLLPSYISGSAYITNFFPSPSPCTCVFPERRQNWLHQVRTCRG